MKLRFHCWGSDIVVGLIFWWKSLFFIDKHRLDTPHSIKIRERDKAPRVNIKATFGPRISHGGHLSYKRRQYFASEIICHDTIWFSPVKNRGTQRWIILVQWREIPIILKICVPIKADPLRPVKVIKAGFYPVSGSCTREVNIRLKIVWCWSLSEPNLECCEIVWVFKRWGEVGHPWFNSELDEIWQICEATLVWLELKASHSKVKLSTWQQRLTVTHYSYCPLI